MDIILGRPGEPSGHSSSNRSFRSSRNSSIQQGATLGQVDSVPAGESGEQPEGRDYRCRAHRHGNDVAHERVDPIRQLS